MPVNATNRHSCVLTSPRAEAGKGEIFVSIARLSIGASKGGQARTEEIVFKTEDLGSGKTRFHYKPTESGSHRIHVAFAELQVRGSPYTINVIPCK